VNKVERAKVVESRKGTTTKDDVMFSEILDYLKEDTLEERKLRLKP
jgi:hypothetical protein